MPRSLDKTVDPNRKLNQLLRCSCEDMVKNVLPKMSNLKNGIDYLLINEGDHNKEIKLKNNEWNDYKYGMYLLGQNITVTVDCNHSKYDKCLDNNDWKENVINENEYGYLKIKTSHLWIKHQSSKIHCNGLGYTSHKGPGHAKKSSYGGGGYGTKGMNDSVYTNEGGGDTYGEETLLKEIHYGSGGGGDYKYGGRGGGVIEMVIEQHMVNHGTITCNGNDGYEGEFYGGGSGGSILMKLGVNDNDNDNDNKDKDKDNENKENENENDENDENRNEMDTKHIFGHILCLGGKGGVNSASGNKGGDGGKGRIAIYAKE